jgi:hypothetical protein
VAGTGRVREVDLGRVREKRRERDDECVIILFIIE